MNTDLPVSMIFAFLLPWLVGALIHETLTVLSMACFSTFLVGMYVSYASSFIFFCETVTEAVRFETNFRLSLKQMYDGDRRSKKETSFIPKTVAKLAMPSPRAIKMFELESDNASTLDRNSMLAKGALDQASFVNIQGSTRLSQYPTTRLLMKSKQYERYDSDFSEQDSVYTDKTWQDELLDESECSDF